MGTRRVPSDAWRLPSSRAGALTDDLASLESPIQRLVRVVVAVQCAFAAVYLVVALVRGTHPPRLIDLDADRTIPEWWSAMLLAGAAAAGFAIWAWARGNRRGWLAVGFGFAFLSLDEVAGIHEAVGASVGEDLLGVSGRAVWPVIYLPLITVIAVVTLRLTRRESGVRSLVPLGLACLALAVLAEALSGVVEQNDTSSDALRGSIGVVTPIEVVIEESLESIGFGLMMAALVTVAIRLHGARFARRDEIRSR